MDHHAIRRSTPPLDLSLYVVLDPEACPDGDVLAVARAALRGGATCLQLRAKAWKDQRRLACVAELLTLTHQAQATCVVNDRLDIAMAAGADGVHVGPGDLPVVALRRLWPRGIVGVSTPSVEAALEAQRGGASYLGCGALFDARASKPDASAPRGIAWLRQLREAGVTLPIVGIGGIDTTTAPKVIAAGANGVAVIRAVCAAEDPEAAARNLRDAVESAR